MQWAAAYLCIVVVVAFAFRAHIARRYSCSSMTILLSLGGVLICAGLFLVWELSRPIHPMSWDQIRKRMELEIDPELAIKRAEEVRENWLRTAEQRLVELGAPASTNGPWLTEDFILFSNDWASYTFESAHSFKGGGLALLRSSDGAFYVSHHHICLGPVWGHRSRPKDLTHFLELYGQEEGWKKR